MNVLRIPCLFLLVAALVVGCGEQVTPTAALEDTVEGTALFESYAGKISNAPSTSGPIVIRSQTAYAVAYADTKAGRLAIHGVDAVAFCTVGAPFDLVDLMSISVPEDANRLNQLIQGDDLTTSVWALPPSPAPLCAIVLSGPPLATGTVDLIHTDNDVLTFLTVDNKNANAFGFNAHGFLTNPDGDRARLNGHSRCVWDGVDSNTLKCNEKVNLH